MNYNDLANQILQLVGGKDNVSNLTHCATRLRFNLKDESLAQTDQLKDTAGVLGVAQSGGQYQVIIGNDVNHVYKPIASQLNLSEDKSGDDGKQEHQSIGAKMIDTITGIFTPILPAITASGMLKALLALLTAFGWLSKESMSYQVINFMADAAFYFLPILLANSAAKKFKCNPYMAMMLGGILLHPTFVSLVAAANEGGAAVSLFGLPIYGASYSSSVIPIILAVWFMSYVEPIADKLSPKHVKFFTKPLITILVAGMATLWVIGPIGYIVASWIADGVNWLNTVVPWLVPVVLGGAFPLLVMTGTHYGIIPIGINNRMTLGYDTLVYPANLCSNLAQGASAFAVALKSKKEKVKELGVSSGITAICGITEPALYGINMRYRQALISCCAGGALGGLYVGLMNVRNYAGGSPGLLTLPGYIGEAGFGDLINACIGGAIAFAASFVITWVLFKDTEEGLKAAAGEQTKHEKKIEKEEKIKAIENAVSEIIASPVDGEAVSLKEVNDPTFAQEIMGKGAAVKPANGHFVSPVDGEVVMVFDTKHAIGLKSQDGAELLIHVGLDTVNLGGKHFNALVKAGDKVAKGQPILDADLDAIAKAGYDTITPVIVTNTMECGDIVSQPKGGIKAGEALVRVIR